MLVIGQCNRTVEGTVNMSCLCQWTEGTSCVCTVVSHLTELTGFFLMKSYNQCLVSFSNFPTSW